MSPRHSLPSINPRCPVCNVRHREVEQARCRQRVEEERDASQFAELTAEQED